MENPHLISYPSPGNLNYFWGFGSVAGVILVLQLATGIFLAMHCVRQQCKALDNAKLPTVAS